MELKNGEKEIFEDEPFNPKYKTYFNFYSKDFFESYFINKGYEIIGFFDNPIFNASKVSEPHVDTNQFTIIVKKIK